MCVCAHIKLCVRDRVCVCASDEAIKCCIICPKQKKNEVKSLTVAMEIKRELALVSVSLKSMQVTGIQLDCRGKLGLPNL